MPTTATATRPRLTPTQAASVQAARVTLDAAKADRDPDRHACHLGALEFIVADLLALIGDLTAPDGAG
jgi:hypothetical protein